MALVILAGNYSSARASTDRTGLNQNANTYYVASTGSDSNTGTPESPLKTLTKAASMLTAGSTLNILPGVYTDQLQITQSGTDSAPIVINGEGVIIDMQGAANPGITLQGSYITVKGMEVKNSNGICVNLTNDYLTVDGLTVHDCDSHGIAVNTAAHIKIFNSTVYHAALANKNRDMSSGWDSGIKVYVSDDVLIQGNTVYNNYGEGMGTRGANITIRGNVVYDNFSVNVYTNSQNALIEKNFIYCTPNSGFERDGKPAGGIGLGEEYFSGWGARLNNARVLNNIVAYCKNGVRYTGADARVSGGGLKNSTIAYNTLYDTVESAIGIVYDSAQTNSLIANNIVWQADNRMASVDNMAGLTFKNNLWKVQPPADVRGPGDRIGEPGFAAAPGYTAVSYRPGNSSLARGGAANIGVTDDYYGASRGPSFDMGAIQTPAIPTTFIDVPAGYWAYTWIEQLYDSGITGGCSTNPLQYCPDTVVTRAQMAVFLLKGVHGSSYNPPAATGGVFGDVPIGYWAVNWVERLAAEGITSGCGNGNYCPDNAVTRAQMAVFLLRARHGSSYAPPAATGAMFNDVPVNYPGSAWIEQLAREGITSGCSSNQYCPDSPVTRAQMAVFLVRAFNLP